MQHLKILAVDDSKSALFALEKLLKSKTTTVVTASDGIEGQAALKMERFDLVITDVDMPNLNGLDFCKWIKTTPETVDIPVIILSSRESDYDIENGFRVGADAYVPKALAAKELVSRIEDVMHKSTYVKRKTILVVEDSKSIRGFLRGGLESEGFQVVLAEDGVDALRLLQSSSPDLILVDLHMPNMGGAELCLKLLGQEKYKGLPIIVMSSMHDKPVVQRLIQEGVSAFIAKPFNLDMLIFSLERILSDHFRKMLDERERLATERRQMLSSISSLAKALEARDHYTHGHSESVTRYAAGIGKELNFSNKEMTQLILAGNLHDLGKIGVRDSVLLKPGKLSDEEFEHIKEHTVFVKEILNPLDQMDDIIQAASSHHERWDGSGYPDGLKGEDIPLFARVIAVADVYDALTSDRPYRDSMSQEKALTIIADGQGTHFCPSIVDAFFRYMKKEQ